MESELSRPAQMRIMVRILAPPFQVSLGSPHVRSALSPPLTQYHTELDEVGSNLPSHPSLELDYTSFPSWSSRYPVTPPYEGYRNDE